MIIGALRVDEWRGDPDSWCTVARDPQDSSGRSVTVSKAKDCDWQIEAATTVVIKERADQIRTRGDGTFRLDEGAVVKHYRTGDIARVEMGGRAALHEVTGNLVLGCSGPMVLNAGEDEATILKGATGTVGYPDPLVGSTVTGVGLTWSPDCLPVLLALGSANHVELALAGMPDDPKTSSRASLWANLPRQEVRERAGAVNVAADLLRQKGASGSDRTRAAWAVMRTRERLARSPFERWLLRGYRALGYGERPGPALLTWLVAAVFGAFILRLTHDTFVDSGYNNTLAHAAIVYGKTLLSPLHLTGLVGETGRNTNAIALLVRAVLAVPFLSGVLATRRFIKDPG